MNTVPELDVVEVNGLRVAHVTADQAMGTDWAARAPDADLVRVPDPQPADWPALRKAGFAVKPNWVTWGAPLRADETEFVARLSANERRDIRYGHRFVAEHDVSFVVDTPLRPKLLEDFLAVYEQQIQGMRHGVPYARQRQDQILAQRESFFAVYAYQQDTLIGGCLCLMQPQTSVVRLGFSAARPTARQGMLVRALYMAVFAQARAMSYRWMSLGTDPSLYGHLAKPGLFTFKSRLGFVPVPLQAIDPDDDGADEADRILRLSALTDPALVLHYGDDPVGARTALAERVATGGRTAGWADPVALALEVLSGRAEVDTRPYRAPFIDPIEVRTLDP